jgi:Flp pilus assembly pilin Flp
MTLRNWVDMFWAFSKRQEGQTMAEYGVVLAVITLGIIAALGFLALAISGKLNAVTTKLGGAIA